MSKIQVLCCGMFAALVSPIAGAHGFHGGLHGVSFMAGVVHPLLGLDHLLAMLGMGVSVAGFSVRGRLAAAGLIVLSLLVGLFGASAMHAPLSVDPLLAATLLMLGLMLLRKHAASFAWRISMIALFTYFHGFAHGAEWPHQHAIWPFAAGVASASLMLFVLGAAIGRQWVMRHPRAQMSLGGVLGMAGLGFLFGA